MKTTNQRETIRNSIRELRRTVSKPYRAAASARICESFAKLDAYQSATKIAAFLAFDGEADPLGLMTLACEQQKEVYVPVVVGKNQPMMFAPWSPSTRMQSNPLGIAEPAVDSTEWIEPKQLDLVVTPLVAFDRLGNRIGVGGGFYDRSFQHLNEIAPGPLRPTQLYGFAFELQKVDAIKRQAWDVVLDGIVTEAQVYQTASAAG